MSRTKPLPFKIERFASLNDDTEIFSFLCPKCHRHIERDTVRYDRKKSLLRLKCPGCRYKFTMQPADREGEGDATEMRGGTTRAEGRAHH